MKKIAILICVIVMLIPLNLSALSITLSWDGSIASGNRTIDHYNIYQSTTSGVYSASPTFKVPSISRSVTFSNLPLKNIYWVVTAIDSGGNESAKSVEVTTKWYVILLNSYKSAPSFMVYWDTN